MKGGHAHGLMDQTRAAAVDSYPTSLVIVRSSNLHDPNMQETVFLSKVFCKR